MGAQGTTTVDFGAHPGSAHATVSITGQASILATSLTEAWVFPDPTADHSADEHAAVPMRVVAGKPTAGVGFQIDCFAPENPGGELAQGCRGSTTSVRDGIRLYGLWTIAWAWN